MSLLLWAKILMVFFPVSHRTGHPNPVAGADGFNDRGSIRCGVDYRLIFTSLTAGSRDLRTATLMINTRSPSEILSNPVAYPTAFKDSQLCTASSSTSSGEGDAR